MILVDSSIWIEFLRGSANASSKLKHLIQQRNRVTITGIVLQEILQGIKDDRTYEITKTRLSFFPYLNADKAAYHLAASIYRKIRQHGITVPSTVSIIAAVALSHNIPVYTKDKHFLLIAQHTGLQLL